MMTAYSPALAVSTAMFELAVAGWALRGPGRARIIRPTAAILGLLAGYQLLEAALCSWPQATPWARVAFADVLWLPPLGVWLVHQLATPTDRRMRRMAQSLFVVAAGLTAWILVDPHFVKQTICQAVIATYKTPGSVYTFYGAFYQLGLMTMIFGANIGMAATDDAPTRRHLADVQLGTLGFVLPSMLTQVLMPQFIGSMPSIMCHYAVVLAVFLARMVARERAHEAELGHSLAT